MSFQQGYGLRLSLSCLGWVAWLVVSVVAQTSNGAAPTHAQEASITREVVNELQLLRQSVERSGLNQSRVALAIERLRLQQDLVTQLNRDLANAQRIVTDYRLLRQTMVDRLKELEQTSNNSTNPHHRKALEEEQKAIKVQIERREQLEQSEQARETDLRTRIAVEQGRLNELNERLDALERELEKQAAASTVLKERKRD